MRNLAAILSFWAATLQLSLASPAEIFHAANDSFKSGDFKTAHSGYKQLLDEGHINADLLYNLGNTSYRLDNKGEATLWYKRAITLNPTHKEARQNFRFLERTNGFLQFAQSEHLDILHSLRRDTLLRIAFIAGWFCILAAAAASILKISSTARTILWFLSPIALVIAITACVGIHFKKQARANLKSTLVVTSQEAYAYTSPARSASTIITLPPGSQIAIVSQRGDWNYINIPGDLRGWIPKSSTEPLWPYSIDLAD